MIKTYIIHVSDAYERERHIEAQLKGKALDVEYILDGDKSQLNDEILKRYFTDKMATISNATSCAYKHILAYEKIASNDSIALILEDDIRFYRNYSLLGDIVKEIQKRELQNFIISLEDSTLKYIPRSQRKRDTLLYPQSKGRCAGAYLMDHQAAKQILRLIKNKKVGLPIDIYHNKCASEKVLDIYWSQPALATQGSFDGSINSIIDADKHGFWRGFTYTAQKIYKRLLYSIR